MAYEQIKPFYSNDMGRARGYCLQNVAKGFHIYPSPNPSGSAKQDMERNRAKGTLHPLNTLPEGVAVPVYLDTVSKYEHIVVYDKGVWWSDGKRINRPASSSCFGWGEWCNGFQIVKYVEKPSSFLPTKGYWCKYDTDPRVGNLANFMFKTFPAYTSRKALGNIYGDNLSRSIAQFQKRTGLFPDGMTGRITYAELKKYGFKG